MKHWNSNSTIFPLNVENKYKCENEKQIQISLQSNLAIDLTEISDDQGNDLMKGSEMSHIEMNSSIRVAFPVHNKSIWIKKQNQMIQVK